MIEVRIAPNSPDNPDSPEAGSGLGAGQTDGQPAEPVARASAARLRTSGAEAARLLLKASGPAGASTGHAPAQEPGCVQHFEVSALDATRLRAFTEGLILGGYRFRVPPEQRVQVITLHGVRDADAVRDGIAAAQAVCWARDLANTPAATKSPAWLAAQAQSLSERGVRLTVREQDWLAARGFGGILGVSAGAAVPPRLIEAAWNPPGAVPGVHVVLVGKGIVFDTGGLNIKPADGMRLMHTDMSGGAAVLGALRLIAARDVPVRVTALVPAAENSVSGSAFRPSDVLRHYGGRTSEIGNTDAEGRLVLADAMAYAVDRLAPSVLVDIATLTGAMKLALGLNVAGFFATDERLARQLLAASGTSDEQLWRMPLAPEYAAMTDSPVADATNSAGNPGAITAAWFLRPFAGQVPWAHLDIAGPARAGADVGWVSKGATGYGTRLLADWVTALG